MSVLIEALTLVVRRSELEARFPGGAVGFLRAAGALEQPPRWACEGDEQLVALSFYDRVHMKPSIALLEMHGLAQVAEGGSGDAVCVAQARGPTAPCAWLDWAMDEDGLTRAWLHGTEPGALAADGEWSLERSRGLIHRRVLARPGRLLRLAEERGVEILLDLASGRQLVGLARGGEDVSGRLAGMTFLGDAALEPVARCVSVEAEPGARDAAASEKEDEEEEEIEEEQEQEQEEDETAVQERVEQLRARIVEVLQAEELEFEPRGEWWLDVPCTARNFRGTVRLAPSENGNYVRIYTGTDARVPEGRRAAACELIARANYGLPVGDFEIDLSDGAVVFKGTIFIADGELGDAQLADAIRGGVYLYDRYYPALMRVVYGGASPAQAIAEVER